MLVNGRCSERLLNVLATYNPLEKGLFCHFLLFWSTSGIPIDVVINKCEVVVLPAPQT